MAKIKLNPLFGGISGAIGDVVFKTSKNGEIYVSSRPQTSSAKPSQAQTANRERFKAASQYAKAAMADPDVRAIYEARAAEEGKSPFAVARSDYYDGNDLLAQR